MLKIDPEIFAENLLLTQIYCEEQLKNTDKSDTQILRSINPICNGESFFTFDTTNSSYVKWASHPWDFKVYDELFENQFEIKKRIKVSDNRVFEGEILIVEIENTVCDGASESNTDGFIDSYDCPPIDTWFYLFQGDVGRTLYAWIPQPFISIVEVGIDVNAMDLFKWQNNKVDVQVKETIKRRPYPKIDFNLKQPISEKHYWVRIGIILVLWLIMYVFRKY